MPEKPILTKEERRTNREARRAKQRAANIGRAAKMHSARILWERAGEPDLSSKIVDSSSRKVYVGCSGWFYWHWRGAFYPRDLPTSGWFNHYAGHFRTVELNAPFYSWPTIATVQTWLRQAGRRKFTYTVKASELITHIKRFNGTKTLVRDFSYIADILGPRMGCFLFQLPPSFHFTTARLLRILSQMIPAHRNVIEFRHPSWWNEEVFRAFRSNGTIFCACSGPRLPDGLIKTAGDVYIRFHGTTKWYRHNYSKAELSAWSEKMRTCEASGIWAYFNNDHDCYSIANAQTLLRLIRK